MQMPNFMIPVDTMCDMIVSVSKFGNRKDIEYA